MLTLESLNGDATFLLTFYASASSHTQFTVLLDPWLHSDAPVLHRKFSNQTHSVAPTLRSLADLPGPLDAIVLSQGKSDHTHQPTLRTLRTPRAGEKAPKIYAVPDAASEVCSWRWAERPEVVVLTREGVKIGIEGGGSVEIAYLRARPWKVPSLHSAVAIRFVDAAGEVTSVVFTPHGSSVGCVREWVGIGGLDLLLWPWTEVRMPWWAGGAISSGVDAGRRVCREIEVGCWVGAHDGEKCVEGWVSRWLSRKEWSGEEVGKVVMRKAVVGEKVVVGGDMAGI